MDTLHLGDSGNEITISHQIFARVTNVSESFLFCSNEMGMIGLGCRNTDDFGYPTVMSNIMKHVDHQLFALYLNGEHDDLSEVDGYDVEHESWNAGIYNDDELDDDVAQGVKENISDDDFGEEAAITVSNAEFHSEMSIGGVNQEHYTGCLNWHKVGGDVGTKDKHKGKTNTGYWDFDIEDVQIAGESMVVFNRERTLTRTLKQTKVYDDGEGPPKLYALLDSGSTYLVGPSAAVSYFAYINRAECFQINEDGNLESVVDCFDDYYDAAMVDCAAPIQSLTFIANGISYTFEKDDLVVRVDGQIHMSGQLEDVEYCLLCIVPSRDNNGWVFGDTFFNKYYTVFDYHKKRVGFAESQEYSDDVCRHDEHISIGDRVRGERGCGCVARFFFKPKFAVRSSIGIPVGDCCFVRRVETELFFLAFQHTRVWRCGTG